MRFVDYTTAGVRDLCSEERKRRGNIARNWRMEGRRGGYTVLDRLSDPGNAAAGKGVLALMEDPNEPRRMRAYCALYGRVGSRVSDEVIARITVAEIVRDGKNGDTERRIESNGEL